MGVDPGIWPQVMEADAADPISIANDLLANVQQLLVIRTQEER